MASQVLTQVLTQVLLVGCTWYGEIIDGAPGLPRSVLSTRLRGLQRDGVVSRVQEGLATTYHLTDCGRELAEVCLSLGRLSPFADVRPATGASTTVERATSP